MGKVGCGVGNKKARRFTPNHRAANSTHGGDDRAGEECRPKARLRNATNAEGSRWLRIKQRPPACKRILTHSFCKGPALPVRPHRPRPPPTPTTGLPSWPTSARRQIPPAEYSLLLSFAPTSPL